MQLTDMLEPSQHGEAAQMAEVGSPLAPIAPAPAPAQPEPELSQGPAPAATPSERVGMRKTPSWLCYCEYCSCSCFTFPAQST